jgi:hypothetical protein
MNFLLFIFKISKVNWFSFLFFIFSSLNFKEEKKEIIVSLSIKIIIKRKQIENIFVWYLCKKKEKINFQALNICLHIYAFLK